MAITSQPLSPVTDIVPTGWGKTVRESVCWAVQPVKGSTTSSVTLYPVGPAVGSVSQSGALGTVPCVVSVPKGVSMVHVARAPAGMSTASTAKVTGEQPSSGKVNPAVTSSCTRTPALVSATQP